MKMNKKKIESELTELYKILTYDPEEYAKHYNACSDCHKMEAGDTYPYRMGVAISIIGHILNDEH